MTQYLILRDLSGNWRPPIVPLAAALEAAQPALAADPHIEMASLTPKDLRVLSRDPKTLALAPVMPTRLISPEPLDGLRPDDVPDDWALQCIGASGSAYSGSGASIALLDTGIDANHPAFIGVDLVSRDFVGTGLDDVNGHGTHVAGTVLGRDLPGCRIGVARQAQRLIIAKTLPDSGTGRSDAFFRAFLWARNQNPDVIGFALSFDVNTHIADLIAQDYPQNLAQAAAIHAYRGNLRLFEMILQMGAPGPAPLVLGAVGNDSLRVISPGFETGPAAPAAANGVLAIGALAPDLAGLTSAAFSNLSPALTAPGVAITSAAPGGGTRCLNGSSMAMAHALGVVALWSEKLRCDDKTVTAPALAAELVRQATYGRFVPELTRMDAGRGLVQSP